MIPQRSGEPRELRDGETVRTEKGVIGVVHRMMQIPGPHRFTVDGISGFWWAGGTRGCLDKEFGPGDIVEILGPAEEDHGDGTVTRVVTLPVTMESRHWRVAEPIEFGIPLDGDTYLSTYEKELLVSTSDSGWQQRLILRPKTPLTPPYVEKLAEAIEADKLSLPPGWEVLTYRKGNGWGFCDEIGWAGLCGRCCGPLPPRQDTDPTEITRAEIDAARERLKSKGGRSV